MNMQQNGIIKPIVQFMHIGDTYAIGRRAVIRPLDHPSELVSNTGPAITSRILSLESDGKDVIKFETQNTVYIRSKNV